jgi:lysophospholipase L1-like esterase
MTKFITCESKNRDNPGVRYIGRFNFSEVQGPKFAWSASTIYARFYGTSVSAKLKSFGDNYFLITIDGEVVINSLQLNEGEEKTFILASQLLEGEHEVCIVKRTEFYLGTAQFLGFNFDDGKIFPPSEPSKRKIEFIGDSVSCGFGNEGEHQSIEYSPKYDNSYLNYASIAARYLKAEHIIIGRSGYGLIRNYDGDKVNTLPKIYSRILPDNEALWQFKNFVPEVVVINLGTNDFSFGFIPDKQEFILGYINLVNEVHRNYPKAKIICAIGPIIEGKALELTRNYIKNDVVDCLREKKEWIYFLEFEHQLESNGYGINFHPSLKTHELMGKYLAKFINKIMVA